MRQQLIYNKTGGQTVNDSKGMSIRERRRKKKEKKERKEEEGALVDRCLVTNN